MSRHQCVNVCLLRDQCAYACVCHVTHVTSSHTHVTSSYTYVTSSSYTYVTSSYTYACVCHVINAHKIDGGAYHDRSIGRITSSSTYA
jgi:hypothetical protein